MRRHDEIDELLGDTGSAGRSGTDLPATSDDPPEAQEIRVEIEQTRTEMSGTIDAIQRRLDPEVLTEQAKEAARDVTEHAVREVRDAALEVTDHAVQQAKEAARDMTGQAKEAAWDATVGRAEQAVGATVETVEEAVSSAGQTVQGVGSIVIETIRQNPVPAALAGLSLGWLFMNRSGGSAGRTSYPYGAGRASYPTGAGRMSSYPYGTGGAAYSYEGRQRPYQEEGQGTTGRIADRVGETASQVGERASEMASSAGEMVSSAGERAGEMASSAGEVVVDTGSDILEIIQRNPIPAALTGLGLAWLYMNRSSGRPAYGARSGSHTWRGTSDYGQYRSEARGPYQARPYSDRGTGGGTLEQAQRKAGDAVSTVQETAGDAADTVRETASDVVDTVRETAGDLVDRAQSGVQRTGGGLMQMAQENPLMTAGVAAALGAAAGFYLPATRREDQLMGRARDRMMGQAQEVTQDAVEKVQRVAGEVQDTARKEAEREGLTT